MNLFSFATGMSQGLSSTLTSLLRKQEIGINLSENICNFGVAIFKHQNYLNKIFLSYVTAQSNDLVNNHLQDQDQNNQNCDQIN